MADDGRVCADAVPAEIELLLFRAAGALMAVDAVQVDAIISREQAGQRAIIVNALSGILGMGSAAAPASSKVLLFREGSETCGIGIDGLDSIVQVKIGTIQPLPELLSEMAALRPFWGVVPRGNDVVLLIDLYRLKGLISRRAEAVA